MMVKVIVLAGADVTLISSKARLSPSTHVEHFHVKFNSNPQMCQQMSAVKKTQTHLEVKPSLAYTSTKELFQTHCPPTLSWHASSQFHRPSLSSLRPLHKPPSNPVGISSMVDLKEWHRLGCLCWKWHHLQPACQRDSWWLSHAVTLAQRFAGSTVRALKGKKLFMKQRQIETIRIPTWFVKTCQKLNPLPLLIHLSYRVLASSSLCVWHLSTEHMISAAKTWISYPPAANCSWPKCNLQPGTRIANTQKCLLMVELSPKCELHIWSGVLKTLKSVLSAVCYLIVT